MTSGTLDIVCTDKGTHKRTPITKLSVEDGRVTGTETRSFFPPDGMRDPRSTLMKVNNEPNLNFVLDCPRCSRCVQLQPDKFNSLVVGLLAGGVSRLDISSLPF